jgi:type II secretory pathway pseudopilin PulG
MTLVELLLVVFILAALAASASSMVEGAHEQARFDDNATRVTLLRRAITGPEDLSAPVAGYVADMGVRPNTIADLLMNPLLGSTSPPALAVDGKYAVDATTRVGSGWRGPYLRGTKRLDAGTLEFPDGWGNAGAAPNFGWVLETAVQDTSLDPRDLRIKSLGSDGSPGPLPAPAELSYRVDSSEVIERVEHHVDLSLWSTRVDIDVTNVIPPSTVIELALRVSYPDGAGGITSVTSEFVAPSPALVFGPNPGVTVPYTPVVNEDPWIPHGVRAVELLYRQSTAPTTIKGTRIVLVEFRARTTPALYLGAFSLTP